MGTQLHAVTIDCRNTTVIVDQRSDSKFRWWVLADPEGNLFCVG
jgi:hypothetical protein